MKPCMDARKVTAAYGIEGPYWSTGVHGGIDYGCPTGDPVYAPWYGIVTGVRNRVTKYGTSWGSAYGTHVVIQFDPLPDGSAGLWGVLAHMSKMGARVGQRVVPGQQVGWSGNTGNSTMPHLHFEVQKQISWVAGSHVDPQPWIDAVPPIVYLSRLMYGVKESPSVKELQDALNNHAMPGAVTLPATGNYYNMTDTEVRRCQDQHGELWGQEVADGPQLSTVGPKQAAHVFSGEHVKIIDDRAIPIIEE